MANEEQVRLLKQGVTVWNRWREEHFATKIDLSQANLKGAILTGANLSAANLSGTNLSEADLRGAILSGAKLIGSNFSKAVMGRTIFGNSDLSEVSGLEDVVHRAPSRIAADTFALSKGKIPEVFLQGCGLNNADIQLTMPASPKLSNEQMNRRFTSQPGFSGFCASYLVEHKPRQ
jgi:uncharacterized protein YjbI with pentapeptide repeats